MSGQTQTTDAVTFINHVIILSVAVLVMGLTITSGSDSLTTKGIFIVADFIAVYIIINFIHEARKEAHEVN